jgi:outer membrane lipoprotein SlyB
MQEQTKSRIHPLVATAAVAVIILSAVAVAAITGYLPGSNAQKADEQAALTPPKAAATAAKPAQPAAAAPAQHRTQVASAAHTAQAAPAKPHCTSCGVVQDVKEVEVKGEGSGVGAVAGGVVGAVVGNQFGHGTGNTVMTVAGAAGGALAGNEIEKHVKTKKRYDVAVKMADGSMKTVSFEAQPTWRSGDHVRVENGTLQAAR